ncbi:MAG: hypothetical protein LBD80_01390 [Tannerella sp.]|jgi:hypothetical protein|nr:hypothetical protein [Tannerella sp.]
MNLQSESAQAISVRIKRSRQWVYKWIARYKQDSHGKMISTNLQKSRLEKEIDLTQKIFVEEGCLIFIRFIYSDLKLTVLNTVFILKPELRQFHGWQPVYCFLSLVSVECSCCRILFYICNFFIYLHGKFNGKIHD